MADNNIGFPVIAGFAAAIALILTLSIIYHPTSLITYPVPVHPMLTFGPSWHYAGNETSRTLGGEYCADLGIACPSSQPLVTGEKYVNNDTGLVAYLVHEGETRMNGNQVIEQIEAYIVFMNDKVYCVSTNSTNAIFALYNKCPHVIN